MPYSKKIIEEKRVLLRRQNAEVRKFSENVYVTCVCGRFIRIIHAYRCYYCRLWFCWTCAGYHFKKPEIR